MRTGRAGRFLLVSGLVVGLLASAALILGLKPSQLPSAMLDIAAYKLSFLAALGLMAAGAGLLRHARRDPKAVRGAAEPHALAEPPPSFVERTNEAAHQSKD